MPVPSRLRTAGLLVALLLLAAPLYGQQRPVTFTDLMQFRAIEQPVLSDDGTWVAFTAQPDRGDPEAVVQATRRNVRYAVPNGSHPVIAPGGAWVAVRVNPPLAETERAKDAKDAKDKPRLGMALVETATGNVTTFDDVERFAFSVDGRFLAYHHAKPKADSTGSTTADGTASGDKDKREAGSTLVLRALAGGAEVRLPFVRNFAFDEAGTWVAYSVMTTDHADDGLYARNLASGDTRTLDARAGGRYDALAWSEAGNHLAFLAAAEDAKGKVADATLYLWDGNGDPRVATTPAEAPEGWTLPVDHQTLTWSDDGERLFFGYRPQRDDEDAEKDTTAAFNPYDLDDILDKRTVDVWHTDDPRINPQQKKVWEREHDQVYAAVYHMAEARAVALTDTEVQARELPDNPHRLLARAGAPYFKDMTWDGSYYDLYVVDLADGSRQQVAARLGDDASLSPGGRYVAYYDAEDWHIYDAERRTTLTRQMDVPFGDEDHDYPSDVPGYGIGGWVEGDAAVLIYDKYDVWQFPTDGSDPINLTAGAGRAEKRIFRVVRTDDDQDAFAPGQPLLLRAYHDLKKNYGFYRAHVGRAGAEPLLEAEKKFDFVDKADEADVYLYTREAYDEFPDLWVSDTDFDERRKVSDANPQMAELAWGKAELVEWTSADGIPLQGVVIKPAGYEPGKRYPVMTYFYRFFSQRLHEFNQPQVNHRPAFPLYASDGYLIFLPDVRFEVGRPGLAAVKSIVPGVQKLVDLGLADPDALGLHGHSWSGYQAAFIVTQTDIFKATIAGAPVSNMTSAYGGIRWGSGLARQFQYEKTQSRIGGSLWEARDLYIDNSPLFFADRINTPMLIIHGDDDGAVPWYQSIELYLALRRLGKDAVFLQYRGEDHHPATYANKLDWAMKMKAYFDYYLKGDPAPAWLEVGEPYAGK